MDGFGQVRRAARAAAPAIALTLSILLLVVPLRLGQGFIPTPLVPLMIVFLHSVYQPEALPAPVVFAMGLLHDLLYGGGLGVWAAAYLSMQYMVFTQREYLRGRVRHVIWLAFGVAMVGVSALLWGLQSLLANAWLPLWPLLAQMVVTIAVYPLAATVFFTLRARAAALAEREG